MNGGIGAGFASLGYTREDLVPILCALALLAVAMLAGPRLPSEVRREATAALLVPLFGYPALVRLCTRLRLPLWAVNLARLAGVGLAFWSVMWRWSLDLGLRLGSPGWESGVAESPWVTWSSLAFFAAAVLWLLLTRQEAVLARGRLGASLALALGCLVRLAAPAPSFPSWTCAVAASTGVAAWPTWGTLPIAIAAIALCAAALVSGHATILTAGVGITVGAVSGVLARLLSHRDSAA